MGDAQPNPALTNFDCLSLKKKVAQMRREASDLMRCARKILESADELSLMLDIAPTISPKAAEDYISARLEHLEREPTQADHSAMTRVPRAFRGLILMLAARYDITISMLLGQGKTLSVAQPRQMAMVVMLEAGLSSTVVGKIFERDHTTVLHARDRHPRKMRTDPIYQERFLSLCKALRAPANADLAKPVSRRCEGCHELFSCTNVAQVTCPSCASFDTKMTQALAAVPISLARSTA